MRPVMITLEGFQGYRDPQTVDLSTVDRAAITGRVGAGKSSLLDAVNFALFGKVRVPTKDGVIHTAADKASVEIEFLEHGHLYKATRTLTRSGNAKAYLWRQDENTGDWQPEGDQDGRVGVTDKAINDLIGLNWEAFRASVIVEQGKSSGFADASPSERHALLSQIVGLDRYARMAEAASEERKNVRNQLVRVRARIEEQTNLLASAEETATRHDQLATAHENTVKALADLDRAVQDATKDADLARARLDLAQQQAHLSTARTAADATLAQASAHLGDVTATADRVRTVAETLPSATANLAAATEAHAAADAAVGEATRAGEEARARLDRATADRTRATDALGVVRARLDGLTRHDNDGCFTCGQPLPDDVRAKVVADLRREEAALTATIRDLDEQVNAATAARSSATQAYSTAISAARAAQAAVDAATRPVHTAQQAAADLPDLDARVASATANVEQARAARAALEGGDDVDLDGAQRTWQAAAARVRHVTEQRENARQQAASDEATIAVLADRMRSHAAARDAITALSKQEDTLEADEAGWTRLIEAYSPAGVPRMILDTAITDINVDLDAELAALSGGALTASLDTMRTTKAGTMRSEITLTVVGQDGARVYESFSGGQRFLVDLALHLALTRTLARRHGSTLDFLAIDEGWGSIEGEEREAVLRALHDVASDNNALLLAITHVSEVADSFPTRIDTEMVSGTSVTSIQ